MSANKQHKNQINSVIRDSLNLSAEILVQDDGVMALTSRLHRECRLISDGKG